MRRWTGCWPARTAIENALAARHLANGTLVLYDVSSAAFEGRTCPLGAIGHARDGVKGRLQIVYGLLCSPAGMPIAIEVFEGNTADPKTLAAQIAKLKNRFGLTRVCLVGDRGMLTSARIRDELRPAQLDWISALRAPQIKALVEDGALQLSLFDEQDLVEITSPDFPGERLVCCHNPVLAAERARKRRELLAATEKELATIAAATRARPTAVARQRQDRAAGGQGDQPLQDGQTLHPRDHRRVLHVHPQHRGHRRRGRPRRHLRAAHQPAHRHPAPPTTWCCATRDSKTSNGSSAPSTPNSTCGPSATGWPTGSAPTCSCACCPTTSAGT